MFADILQWPKSASEVPIMELLPWEACIIPGFWPDLVVHDKGQHGIVGAQHFVSHVLSLGGSSKGTFNFCYAFSSPLDSH